MSAPILEAKGVSVRFDSGRGSVEALKGISIELNSGGSLALVGESGSGKTTLLRACIGLTPLSGGQVTLFGKDISLAGRNELVSLRRRCGYIPQDPFGCVPPTLCSLDAVAEPIRIARSGDNSAALGRAGDLLEECGIKDRALWKERVRLSLSGGQRQRVSIARALALDPEILLADEPASMQDASTRGEIMGILQKRVKAGMGIIMATHDLVLAASAVSTIIVMYMGKAVERGPSKEILAAPLHPYSRALVAAIPGMGHPPEPLARDTGEVSLDEGCAFASRCPLRSGICTETPPMVYQGNGRYVACWKRCSDIF